MSDIAFQIEPGSQEIVLTRTFDAPRELVFRTMNDPGLIPRWWGPRGTTTRVDEMEVRRGGRWRYVVGGGDGEEQAFSGVYHSVNAPDRIIATFEWEGAPGHVLLQSLTLEDLGGRTRLVEHSVYQSVADRDAMVATGMASGATDTMDRLEELLAEARVGR